MIVGCDTGYATTGLAIWRAGEVTLRTVRTKADGKGENDKAERRQRMRQEITKVIGLISITDIVDGRMVVHNGFVYGSDCLVVLEGVYHRKGKGAVSLDLAATRAVVIDSLMWARVPWVSAAPQTIKLFATGHGDANKREMIAACREQLKLAPRNDNEADAAWMMAAGLTRTREGREWLTERGVIIPPALEEKITWPALPWATDQEMISSE